ncbi:MAG: hypothetical protein LBI82_07585 [Dysgonamonadaceae bacterium]|nr:hypothetical protein [Dysgonamonadaceae bacterium]
MKKLFLATVILLSFLFQVNAQTASEVTVLDTRSVNSLPSAYGHVAKFELKQRNIIGVPGAGTYSGMLTIAPWVDNSGGKHHQINFNEGGIYYRSAFFQDNAWGAWQQFILANADGSVCLPAGKSYRIGSSDDTGNRLRLHHNGSGAYVDYEPILYVRSGANTIATFLQNGNVGIGVITPIYKLEVAGTIRAREVKIDVNTGADFVFAPDYNLKPLSDVESFIHVNKHLPEIPSEKAMQEDGLSINEFQIKLLQKIEELTLYAIEQNKKIEKMEKEIETLQNK